MTNVQPIGRPSNSALALTETLDLRSAVIVHPESGAPTHIECRLWRAAPADAEPDRMLPTAAGFRVPLRVVPDFLDQVRALEAAALVAGAPDAASKVAGRVFA